MTGSRGEQVSNETGVNNANLVQAGHIDHVHFHAAAKPEQVIKPVGRPVNQYTDPFALEVHRAIGHADSLPVLPRYVPRTHDAALGAVVQRGVAGESAIAVLIGGSSTGKTRACWEAVQTLPEGWRLWHPLDPTRPEAALAALDGVGSRTVVWLNESQHYLNTPGTDLGERVAARLRELLRDPERAPVLVLGTVWPEYWAVLTTAANPGALDDHAQARALLSASGVTVPTVFEGGDLDALRAAAAYDPRLAQASTQAEQGQITQYLAGVPALLERYETAPAAAKAFITAAMDARRLGHSVTIPGPLLEMAAGGYLTDQQWDELDDGWLGASLTYAGAPARGARGPLTRMRPRPGAAAFAEPYFRLADYLEQHGRATRRNLPIPASLWDALIKHGRTSDLTSLAESARARGLIRIAFLLYVSAWRHGDASAPIRVATMLRKSDRADEALVWYELAEKAGDTKAMQAAAAMLDAAGRADEALAWYERAAVAGDANALWQTTDILWKLRRIDEALAWYERGALAGNSEALARGANKLRKSGRVEEAFAWCQRAAEAGNSEPLWRLNRLIRTRGWTNQALTSYEQAAAAGDPDAIPCAIEMLRLDGWKQDGVAWLEVRAHAGDPHAMKALQAIRQVDEPPAEDAPSDVQDAVDTFEYTMSRADELVLEGLLPEAFEVYQRLLGGSMPLSHAMKLLREHGKDVEAIDWLRSRLRAGDSDALWFLLPLLENTGCIDEAIAWCEREVERARFAGGGWIHMLAGEILQRADRDCEALEWYQRAVYAGQSDGYWPVITMLEAAGLSEDLISWYDRATAYQSETALLWAAESMQREGRADEAAFWRRLASDAANSPQEEFDVPLDRVEGWVGYLRRKTGSVANSLAWLHQRADEGSSDAVWKMAFLLRITGRIDDALVWYERAADIDVVEACALVGEMLQRAGRVAEALVCYQRAADHGDVDCLLRGATLLRDWGRVDDALGWYLRAVDIGVDRAISQAVEMLQDARRNDEATRLRMYGLEPGGAIAMPWSATEELHA